MSRLRGLIVMVAALFGPALLAAQEAATISGRVTNESGAPVAFAGVFLEGMAIGAQTRENGNYSIVVPAARA
ncbi:MAG: carboxypeptidase regulatory-like domain-containing protein, partial [Gemmatimonadaceae bacterium]